MADSLRSLPPESVLLHAASSRLDNGTFTIEYRVRRDQISTEPPEDLRPTEIG